MPEDLELLRRYADDGSEEAFAELVRQRIDFVYSVALRQVGGDAHLAQDVAQRVFSDLARKAGPLSRHAVLTGWLYRSTQFAASDLVRAERRRRAREAQAQAMEDIMKDDSPEWERMRPAIDRAMADLNERDRDAIMLRFFEGKAFAEVGARLQLTEDAARVRVARAIEKLRGLLVKQGVTSTAAALGVALGTPAGIAAPAGLAASVAGTAMAAGSTAVPAATLLTFLAMNKTTSAIVGTAIAIAAIAVPQHLASGKLEQEVVRLEAQEGRLERERAESLRLAALAAGRGANAQMAAELDQLRGRAAGLRAALAQRPAPVAPVLTPEAQAERDRLNREREAAARAGPQNAVPIPWSEPAPTPNTGPTMTLRLETPSMAYQTLASAALYGRLDLLAQGFSYEPPARARLEAFFGRLPERVRRELGSADAMIAPTLAPWVWKEGKPQSTRFEGGPLRQSLDQADVVLTLGVRYTSGPFREETFPFRREGQEWKYGPLSPASVDELLAAIDPVTGKPRAK